MNYGALLLDNKDPDSAAWIFREALKIDDTSADAHLGFATALNQLNAPDQAYLEVRTALSLDPHNATAHHLLAELHRQRREWRQALLEVREAIALDDKTPAFQLTLGRLLEAEGHVDEAMGAYQRYLNLAPDDPDADDLALQVRIWQETRSRR
jgi:Tfp pilus assembly protein PilF